MTRYTAAQDLMALQAFEPAFEKSLEFALNDMDRLTDLAESVEELRGTYISLYGSDVAADIMDEKTWKIVETLIHDLIDSVLDLLGDE